MAPDMIAWSERCPEVAAMLWPRVLAELRSDDCRGLTRALNLMLLAANDEVNDLAGYERKLGDGSLDQ
jgi:hypothetical protein